MKKLSSKITQGENYQELKKEVGELLRNNTPNSYGFCNHDFEHFAELFIAVQAHINLPLGNILTHNEEEEKKELQETTS